MARRRHPGGGDVRGWPKTLREFTMLDPCCGSGHFLVAGVPPAGAAAHARRGTLRQEAVDAVLRENLFGLETRPPLHSDRRVRPGDGSLEVPG